MTVQAFASDRARTRGARSALRTAFSQQVPAILGTTRTKSSRNWIFHKERARTKEPCASNMHDRPPCSPVRRLDRRAQVAQSCSRLGRPRALYARRACRARRPSAGPQQHRGDARWHAYLLGARLLSRPRMAACWCTARQNPSRQHQRAHMT